MNIVVAIKHIPNLADELELNDDGTNLEFDEIDFVLNEFDEQAVEQAVLIKEAGGGTVTVLGVDLIDELDGVLYTALAKGADKAVKIVGDLEPGIDSHTHARWLAEAIREMDADIVLTGVQAADDLDGQIGPMLAAHLDIPYVGVVTGVEVSHRVATLYKEYAGGVMGKYAVGLPMVVGVQAATKPPRYAPISKVRQIANSVDIDEIEVDDEGPGAGLTLHKMSPPVSAGHAEMLAGDAEEVAERIIEIIKERGLIS
jgi:electron transfer flavoprotein beta subunit